MKSIRFIALVIVIAVQLAACTSYTGPGTTPAGKEKSAKTEALETGAALLQTQRPLDAMNIYLDGFHFHNGDMGRQIEAHHFCSQVNEELVQCVIFDGNGPDALLMGIEYVVSERLFESLPKEEKKLWHSHAYEVKSGQLVGPGLPDAAEHELMKKLVSTYGKTWHTWHLELPDNRLPLGIPALMMGFTGDGQADPAMVAERDRRFEISSEAKQKNRADIPAPPVQPGADAWQKGDVAQLQLMRQPTKKRQ